MRSGMLLAVLIVCGCRAGSERAPRSNETASAETVSGSEEAPAPSTVVPETPPPPPFEPVTLTVRQRSTTELPIPDRQLRLTVDDITRGQVMASLALADGTVLHAPVSLQTGGVLPFAIDGRSFQVELTTLENQLVGDDFAEFVLKAAEDVSNDPSRLPAQPVLTDREKIERLIEAVAAEQGAVFIRNGEAHSSSEAAEHLRNKWQAAGDRIQTADDFIEQLASRSSLTGEEYVIRSADGSERRAAEFLRATLRNLNSPTSE